MVALAAYQLERLLVLPLRSVDSSTRPSPLHGRCPLSRLWGSLRLPLAHGRVATCSAKLLYHLDGTVSNRSRLRHVGQALGAPPNPLPLRQPGRPGRGPIRHVSLQKCHVFTPITFLPDCYVFMRGRYRVHSQSVQRGCWRYFSWPPAGAVSTASLCRPGAYPTSGHPHLTGRGRPSPAVQYYCMHALAPATRHLYAAGQQHYTNFCRLHARPLGPATDTTLAEFVTYLADVVHLTPTSIKTYLSAVRSLHIDRGWPDPLQAAPLTQRVLSGVKRIHGMHSRLNRLPITGTVLDRLVRSLQAASWLPIIDRHMLTAACTLAFHGFLRCSEFTTGLSRSSIRVLSSPQPHIELRLLASKTDPFRRGATITIGASSGPCCPVSSLARYLDATRRSSNDTPLFKFTSGTPLTRAVFTQHIQRALTETGFANSSRFMSHSFRIGAATTAAEVGVPAWLIKTMGRWSSDAYQQYIRTPLATRLAVAQQLTPLRRSEPSASTSTQSRPSPDTQPHS